MSSRISRKKTIHNNKYKPSDGIKDFIKKLEDSTEPTILNLDTYKLSFSDKLKLKPKNKNEDTIYNKFKLFFNTTVNKVSKELDENKGPIIDCHLPDEYNNDENTKAAMQEIVDKYKKLYLNDLINDGYHQLTSDTKEIYPNYLEDLYSQNEKPYIDFEKQNFLGNPISEKNDEEFFDTLKLRIKGLDECKNKLEGQFETAESYFNEEYDNENDKYEEIKDNKDLNIDDKIREQCNAIQYGDEILIKSKEILNDSKLNLNLDKLIDFFNTNPNELEFAKTFLPEDFFIGLNNDNIRLKLKNLILKNDRKMRQYVFGFYSEKKYNKIRPLTPFLYETSNILIPKDSNKSCNFLINWNIISNLLFCRCAISNNQTLCSTRFIISDTEETKLLKNIDNDGNKTIEFELKNPPPILDLFNSNCIFTSILTIKYFHEESNTFRVWFLYIFKNNNCQKTTDFISGIRDTYFIVNSNLKFVNKGQLFQRHNVTHSELSFFINFNKKNKEKIYFYNIYLYNNTIFISSYNDLNDIKKYPILSNLQMKRIDINTKPYFTKNKEYPTNTFIIKEINTLMVGGNINNLYKITTTTNDKLFYNININIAGINYLNYINKTYKLTELHIKNNIEYKKKYELVSNILYDYLLISNDNIYIISNVFKKINKNYVITNYIPLSNYYYNYVEIFNKYKLLNINKNDNILLFGLQITPIEFIKLNNYKINKINIVIPNFIVEKNKNIYIKWINYINSIKKIYDIEIINFKENLYKLSFENINYITNNNKIVIYNIFNFEYGIPDNYVNLPNIFIGALIGLKYTQIDGSFILNLGSIECKQFADIYLILSQYFKEHYLYYPEISNLYKKTGTQAIFKGYKGISNNEYNKLIDILNSIEKIYPNGTSDFNIYDPEIRKKFYITKLINPKLEINNKNIIGLLDTKLNDAIYNEIRIFNEERYLKQDIYMNKLLKYMNMSNEDLESIKVPTQEQITNAIFYCKKYDIPYIDKFSNPVFQDKFGKQILHEAYGLHEPIIYKFKTPFTLKIKQNISLKITSNKKNKKTLKKSKNSSSNFRLSKLFNDNSLYFLKKTSKTKTHKTKTHKANSNVQYNNKLNLIPELDIINNRIEQTNKLIDSRRDFDAPDENMQNLKWFEANKQFRYYKHKHDKEKIHLDKKIQKLLGDFNISQAWLKMYEIITDCNLIPTQRKGTFKSFHICEAPGTFINCINNYVSTKTKYDAFEWKAQSLKSTGRINKGTAFGDDFGIIKRHKERWDWGEDGSGDITKISNINYYEKVVRAMSGVELITSDCGLPNKCAGYEKVAFASLLTILQILPKGGSMVYKILTPIDEPIILNLIYIAYANFKEFIFYKPVQNSQSREFYIVGKGYLGIDSHILENFFNELKNFKEGEEIDLFNDMYPESFVRQFIKASKDLSDNYVYTIERQIYFIDNKDALPKEFNKLFYDYYNEKNEDWIRKYKPMRLDRQFVL